MKKRGLWLIGIGGLLVCNSYLWSGQGDRKLQVLHREIGNKLMRIKKNHPQSQSVVYSILDKLGQYHSVSKHVLKKKRKYKQLLKTESENSKTLQEEVERMEQRISKMKRLIIEASDKLKKDLVAVNELKEQKEKLVKEREMFLKEKEKFEFAKQQFMSEREHGPNKQAQPLRQYSHDGLS
jgi:chromosome segregation ATPase